jgi:Icc-related predicted phosphoesterase
MLELGTIGCPHGKIGSVKKIAKKFSKKDINAVILLGDINSDKKPYQSIVTILKILSKLKKPVFVIPGSHEPVEAYKKALKKFRKNKYIFDCTLKRNRTRSLNGYELVFLPGSDWLEEGAGFVLKDSRNIFKKKKAKEISKYYRAIVQLFYVKDLRKLVKHPKKTILISHIPPKFKKLTAIDVAEFGKLKSDTKKFKIKERDQKALQYVTLLWEGEIKDVVFSLNAAKNLIKKGYPLKILHKNAGNIVLKQIIKKLKIKKQICSHIHEAGQRGCDLKGNLIKQNSWSKELFYNPGPAKEGKAGVYTIEGDRAKYENMK